VSTPTPELAAAQEEIVRLRVGLQDLLRAAAVEALHDGNPNAVRAKFTSMTTQIEQLLGLGAGDPAWTTPTEGELTAALSQALVQRGELQARVHALDSEIDKDNAALRRQAQEIIERGEQIFALLAEVARLRRSIAQFAAAMRDPSGAWDEMTDPQQAACNALMALSAALVQRSELRAEVALIRSELRAALTAAKDEADWSWDDWWH
jgi:chromosome segregation ATPase